MHVRQRIQQAQHEHATGRRLQDVGAVTGDLQSGLKDLLCFGSDAEGDGTPIFQEYDITIFGFPIKFPLVPFVLSLVGRIRAGVVISAEAAGRFCLLKKNADVSTTPIIALQVACDLYLEVLVVRGGISMELQVIRVGVRPVGTLELTTGVKGGSDVFLVFYPPTIAIMAFLEYPKIQFCPEGKKFPVYPCGVTWKQRDEFPIFGPVELTVKGMKKGLKLLFAFPEKPDGDATPPEAGETWIGQIFTHSIHLQKPNWQDTETDITSVRYLAGSTNGASNFLDAAVDENVADETMGLTTVPPSGTNVHFCVEATNSDSKKTMKCSNAPLVWDTSPPSVRTWLWDSGRAAYGSGSAYGNSSFLVRFQMAIGDVPAAAENGVASVQWGIAARRMDAPDDTFRPLADERLAMVAALKGVDLAEAHKLRFTIDHDLFLQDPGGLRHNTKYYVHVHSCDSLANCGMHHSAPLHIDLTAPVAPAVASILANRRAIEPTPVWTHPEILRLAWNEGFMEVTDPLGFTVKTRNPVPDPESSPVEATWRIYTYDGAHRLRQHTGDFDPMPLSIGTNSYSGLRAANLTLGQRYVVQVTALVAIHAASHAASLQVAPPPA